MDKKYKVILFDLDGTVCDSDLVIIKSYRELFALYLPEKEITDQEICTFSGPPLESTMKKQFPTFDTEFMKNEYQRVTVKYYEKYIKTFPYVKETLLELKKRGIKIGLVTNKVRSATLLTLRLCSIEGIFDCLVCQDDAINSKPDPEMMNMAMEKLGVKNKEDVLYIGDNDIDYHSAHNSGIDSMLFKFAPRVLEKEELFNHVIYDFREVLNYV